MIIDRFINEFYFLSNFYPSTIVINGKSYSSVEHAYQASKTLVASEQDVIRNAKSPGIAKKLGKSVQLRNDWNDVKLDLMREFIKKKFENPFLRPLLLATEDVELIEVNFWNDCFWGVCRGKGENWLGKILMEERDNIHNEENSE
jgi:hypothetical protein